MELSSPLVKVLLNIFKFLPLDDRKSVRLTCHQWNDACNSQEIIVREKFVFHRGNVARMKVPFANCKVLRSDFEFYGLSLQKLPQTLWQHSANRLQSLLIYDCEIDDRTMENIILYCTNLVSFHIITPPGPYEPDLLFCSEDTLDNLIRRKIVQTNLHSFYILTLIYISHRMFKKLFQIYPNIRTFGVLNSNSYEKEKLPLPQSIENFVYPSGRAAGLLMKQFNENPRLKFKEFEIGFLKNCDVDVLLHFISYQTELEKVKLTISGISPDKRAKELLFHTMSLPKLKEFQFNAFCDIHFTIDEFSQFLTKISRLESLALRFHVCSLRDSHLTKLELPSVACTRLKTLQLEFNLNANKIYMEILKRCPSLHSLHLNAVNAEVLQYIFKDHTELRTLSLFNRKRANPVNPTKFSNINLRKVSYPCSRLRKLERLDVRGIKHLEMNGVTYDVLDTFFSQFDYPNLKCFYYHLLPCDKSFVNRLLNMLSVKAPRLQMLKLVSSHFVEEDDLVKYCRQLKGLMFIDICSPFFKRKVVEKLFIECPSLRYVGESYHFRGTYSYDRFSRTLKKFDYPYMQSFYKSSVPDT